MAPGSLIIQKRANPGDRKLVKEIARNVSYQNFLGLQSRLPVANATLVASDSQASTFL